MSESEGGWHSSWQRPQEGAWKQAPDGTWYKDAASSPQPVAPRPAQFVTGAPGSGKAIAALILGIGGLTFFPFILSVLALVLGYQARAEIDRAGGAATGRGQATAGIVLGWVGVAIFVLMIALVVGLAVSVGAAQIPLG
jgi:hypothetical protein